MDPAVLNSRSPLLQDLDAALTRLFGEWNDVRQLLGLRPGVTGARLSQTLGIDRGTAQRLAKLCRLTSVSAADLASIPGTTAWNMIALGVKDRLGEDHPQTKRFSAACDRFAEAIDHLGGSRAAALRALQSRPDDLTPHAGSARRAWTEAAIATFGYSVDVHFSLVLFRPSPDDPKLVDEASLRGLLNCSGSPGSHPIAVRRYSTSDGAALRPGSPGHAARAFAIIEAGTSTPIPELLATGDASSQIAIIEPTWTERTEPFRLTTLLMNRNSAEIPWLSPPPILEVETLNRYPARRLVCSYLIHHELDLDTRAAFGAFLDRRIPGLGRPWFDRLPDRSTLSRTPAPFLISDHPDVPNHKAIVSEMFRRLSWDHAPYTLYSITIEYPVPLARYVFTLERLDPSAVSPDPSP